jgi:H+/Cl- antiporter ClcA
LKDGKSIRDQYCACHDSNRVGRNILPGKHLNYIYELAAAVLVALVSWAIGVTGLEIVKAETSGIAASGIGRISLLLAAPFFLGITSYFLVRWGGGCRGPSELIALLKQRSSTFPGWARTTIAWLITCIGLGSNLSPKGFEGPYLAAAGGLSGWITTRLSFDAKARRRLARCGLGVAFGVLFRSPLGGLICAFEFGDFEIREFRKQFFPAMIATLAGFVLTDATQLPAPFAAISFAPRLTARDIVLLVFVGIACGVVAIFYVFLIRHSKIIFRFLEKKGVPAAFIPMMGATVSTVLGAFFYTILGSNELSRIIDDSPAVPLMLFGTIIAKTVATAAADGSKCAGGTVGPAILTGALVGRLVGIMGGSLNPLFAAAGSAALIGPIAGLPLTMLVTGVTWLGFAPVAWVIIIPLLFSKAVCWRTELYPYKQSIRTRAIQEIDG